MAITAYRPTTDIFRSFFDDVMTPGLGGRSGGADLLRTPTADVVESNDHIRVTLEIPGMRGEDIEVNLENNLLTISGEKKEVRREQSDDAVRTELAAALGP